MLHAQLRTCWAQGMLQPVQCFKNATSGDRRTCCPIVIEDVSVLHVPSAGGACCTLPQDRGYTTLIHGTDALLTLRKSVFCMRPVLTALMEYSAMCIKGCLDTCGLAGMPAVTSRCSCTKRSKDQFCCSSVVKLATSCCGVLVLGVRDAGNQAATRCSQTNRLMWA